MDFVVIGAGMAGASVAHALARFGSVVVVEAEDVPGYHSTGRSAATFNHSYGARPLRLLAKASEAFFSSHSLLSARGALLIAHRDKPELLNLELPSLSPREVCARVPVLREDWLAGGQLDEQSRDIDVAALHQLYLRGLKVVTNARVIGLRPGWIVSTTQGDFDAKVVVNAAGAWGDVIASLAGVPTIGLQAKRRSAFTFDTPIEARGWPMVIDRDERFYFKPEGHRILASPANQEPVPPQDASPDELDIALGVDRLRQCTTLRVDRIFRKWAGLRTFAPGKPLVCDFAAPGLFFFLGQGGSGIKIAPAAARLAAALIVGNGVPAELLEAGFDVGTVRYSPI